MVRNPLECADLGPGNPAGNRAFVFIGRFEEEKGVRLFAEAARSTGLPAVFIGDGALSSELRRICPDGVFTGWLEPREVRRHLAGARALVFPSLWYETLGLVVVEAAAAGIPVIVASRCSATDVIQDGRNGLHFTHGSADALARRMVELAGDDPLAARLGRAAYDGYWSDPWTVERHVGQLESVYGMLTSAQ
jgi:glycosyltransferase involved in cell wall biosynthesis